MIVNNKEKFSGILFIVFGLVVLAGFVMIFILSFSYNVKTSEFVEGDSLAVEKKLSDKDYLNSLVNNKDKKIKIAFFGDVMIDRNVKNKIDKNSFNYLFAKVASSSKWQDVLESDAIVANLEGAVTDKGAHYKPDMSYDFAFAPERIEELRDYGFDTFNIANNHLADQGESGIIETSKNLDELGIFYFGCHDRQVGECSIKTKEINGRKIGWAGFSMVYGKLDEELAIDKIKHLASSTDLVIVNMHWGVEYEHHFNKAQQTLAHKLIDAGADIIIGHHPHVVQGMEIYKKRPIFYSLGNFIFDQYFSLDTQQGLGVLLEINDDNFDIILLPIKSKASQISWMDQKEKDIFLEEVVSWSLLQAEDVDQILSNAQR